MCLQNDLMIDGYDLDDSWNDGDDESVITQKICRFTVPYLSIDKSV